MVLHELHRLTKLSTVMYSFLILFYLRAFYRLRDQIKRINPLLSIPVVLLFRLASKFLQLKFEAQNQHSTKIIYLTSFSITNYMPYHLQNHFVDIAFILSRRSPTQRLIWLRSFYVRVKYITWMKIAA